MSFRISPSKSAYVDRFEDALDDEQPGCEADHYMEGARNTESAQGAVCFRASSQRGHRSSTGSIADRHYVESGQIASFSCWLAAAAPTAWVSRPHSGLLRPERQAGFR